VDLSGPRHEACPSGAKYMVVGVAAIQSKDNTALPLLPFVRTITTKGSTEVAQAMHEIVNEIEALTLPQASAGQRIVRIQTDKGTEYQGKDFLELLKTRFIHPTTTTGYDPQANGTA
jgi:hypothetical protein